MENPYEEAHAVILNRIIGNVEKMNEGMLELNRAIHQTNIYNSQVAEVVELWTTYLRNVRYNLESTKTLEDPI